MQPSRGAKWAAYILLVAMLVVVILPRPASAASGSAMDLINAVNAFRAEYGLKPYQVDGTLMSTAQNQSDYMASIKKLTHTRPDGSGPGAYGITAENIGGGLNVSVDTIVREQWSDQLHWLTLVGWETGLVGAGMAEADGVVYYTLDMKRTGPAANPQKGSPAPGETAAAGTEEAPAGATPAGAQPNPSEEVIPVETATRQSNGAIFHLVQPGQTLWSIALAYDTTSDALIALNGLDVKKPLIYAGQKLYIGGMYTPTVTETVTGTPAPPTATLKPTRTIHSLRATRTPGLPETPTPQPFVSPLAGLGQRWWAIGVAVILGAALFLFVTFGWKGNEK